MKKIIIAFFGLLPAVLMAQVDRTKAPQPGPAPQIKIGQPVTYTLPNGLTVFVVQNTKLPRVSATLSFNIDGIVEGDKAGLTSMAGELLRRGTAKMNKAQLDEAIDQLGGSVGTSPFSASASSLVKNFPALFSLFADVVLRPSLPASELEKIRRQQLSGLQAQKDNPGAIASNVVNRLTYGKDHPYGDIETEETISNVKLADVRTFYDTYWKPNNAYLVFVGDIAPADAKRLATQYLGTWKRGPVVNTTYPTPRPPASTFIALVDRPASVQSVINFAEPVELKPGAPDVIPVSVMSSILGGGALTSRLNQNLREKYGFTYGASAGLRPDRLVSTFTASASVRNQKTDSAVGQFLYEFNRIRTEPLSSTEVEQMKNFLSGAFARSLENPATIAAFALNIAKYHLPVDYYRNYLKSLAAVTPQDVQAMAQKYIQPGKMLVTVVGSAKDVATDLAKYGEVKYFDMYGRQVQAPAAKKVDAAVTPESILEKAVKAYGGAEAIGKIKDIQMSGEASIQGQTITVTQKNILPSAFVQEISFQGMVMQKKMLKNGTYSASAQGKEQPLEEKDKEEMMDEAVVFAEPHILSTKGYALNLKGIEQVEGKDAYAVAVTTPAKREYVNYYDVASGLLVKHTAVRQTPAGDVTINTFISDYKPFSGVLIPTRVVNDLGMMKIDIQFADVKVNTGLQLADIK